MAGLTSVVWCWLLCQNNKPLIVFTDEIAALAAFNYCAYHGDGYALVRLLLEGGTLPYTVSLT